MQHDSHGRFKDWHMHLHINTAYHGVILVEMKIPLFDIGACITKW